MFFFYANQYRTNYTLKVNCEQQYTTDVLILIEIVALFRLLRRTVLFCSRFPSKFYLKNVISSLLLQFEDFLLRLKRHIRWSNTRIEKSSECCQLLSNYLCCNDFFFQRFNTMFSMFCFIRNQLIFSTYICNYSNKEHHHKQFFSYPPAVSIDRNYFQSTIDATVIPFQWKLTCRISTSSKFVSSFTVPISL